MIYLMIKIFFVGFFINLLYELLHSLLYKTCLEAPLKKYVYLMLKASAFDGLAIAIIYFFTFSVFTSYQLLIFIIASLVFAYIWEIYSLKKRKWEYANSMPKILGVGVTPLVQLAVTGLLSLYILSLYIAFYLFI